MRDRWLSVFFSYPVSLREKGRKTLDDTASLSVDYSFFKTLILDDKLF